MQGGGGFIPHTPTANHELLNDKAVYRTAPATPGLFLYLKKSTLKSTQKNEFTTKSTQKNKTLKKVKVTQKSKSHPKKYSKK